MQAIILAGGKGTRLQSVVSDVPKPMAPIGDKPFLAYQIQYLINQGVTDIILSVGYKHQIIVDYFGDIYNNAKLTYVVENEPLGTGGGIRLAVETAKTNNVLVVNGDTFFEFDLQKIIYVHHFRKAKFSMATHLIENNGRYGGVVSDANGKITEFTPKDFIGKTEINAGVYLIDKAFYLENTLPNKTFSIEDDFFGPQIVNQFIDAVPFVGKKFLDIGIPSDYSAGQTLIPAWLSSLKVKPSLIIFDRDGVLNKKIDDGYVLSINDLEILYGTFETLAFYKNQAIPTVVATNQRCVGRGQLSIENLNKIHDFLANEIHNNGGEIAKIYFATGQDVSDPDRKPNPGMILRAMIDFEVSDPSQAMMFGDSLTDLQAAKAAGIQTVFLTNKKKINHQILQLSDQIFDNLKDFMDAIKS